MKITPQNISKAVVTSFGTYDHFRKNRGKFMSQMVGRFYRRSRGGSTSEDGKASPLNLLYSAVRTLVPNLVYNDPRIKVVTQTLAFREYGDVLELATNHLIKRIKFRNQLRLSIYDAIFMAGFMKTGLANADEYLDVNGQTVEIGQPYAERVDPDDIILDPMARAWEEQAFVGNRFRADVDDLIESGLYEPDLVQNLSNRYDQNAKGEMEKLAGTRPEDTMSEVRRYVDLCEVYLPREKVIVTVPYDKDGKADKFLRVADYQGPETGPYHMLGFTPVSDNLMPVAPASIWFDLHLMGNKIARKLAKQADRLKSVLAYEDSAEEDAANIAEADDGEARRVSDVNKIKEVKYGGAAPEAYSWMEWVKRNFSEQAGSIDLLSGNSTDSPTATQAEMLQANTSVSLSDMQNIVYQFAAEITRDLAFFLHTDPLINLPLIQRKRVVDPITGQPDLKEVQVNYTPEMRRGDFFDFTFDVQPYSMARPDPNTAVRRKIDFASRVIPAAAQAAMLLGPGFKIGPFLKRMALEVNIEDADEWLDDPSFQDWIMQKIGMSMAQGDPGKAGGMMQMPQAGIAQPPATFNPQQPVPSAMGPQQPVTPGTEQAQAQQEAAGEIQGVRQPSARAIALSR